MGSIPIMIPIGKKMTFEEYDEQQKRFQKDTAICRKRFHTWLKEKHPSFDLRRDIKDYERHFDEYLTLLDPWQMMQEWRVASNWKRERIYKLCKYYKDEYNEDWPLPKL